MGRKTLGDRPLTNAEKQARQRARKALELDRLLRVLIDLTWGEAFEDNSVPSTAIQNRLIKRARVAMKDKTDAK